MIQTIRAGDAQALRYRNGKLFIEPNPLPRSSSDVAQRLIEEQGRVPFLRLFTDHELVLMAPFFELTIFRAHTTLFAEGEPAKSACLVLKGGLEVWKEGGCKNTRYIMATLGAHSWEASMLGGGHYGSTVRAVKDTEVLLIKRQSLDRLVVEHPVIGARLLRELSRVLALRLKKLVERFVRVL